MISIFTTSHTEMLILALPRHKWLLVNASCQLSSRKNLPPPAGEYIIRRKTIWVQLQQFPSLRGTDIQEVLYDWLYLT